MGRNTLKWYHIVKWYEKVQWYHQRQTKFRKKSKDAFFHGLWITGWLCPSRGNGRAWRTHQQFRRALLSRVSAGRVEKTDWSCLVLKKLPIMLGEKLEFPTIPSLARHDLPCLFLWPHLLFLFLSCPVFQIQWSSGYFWKMSSTFLPQALQGWLHFYTQVITSSKRASTRTMWNVSSHPPTLSCSFSADSSPNSCYLFACLMTYWNFKLHKSKYLLFHFWIPNVWCMAHA